MCGEAKNDEILYKLNYEYDTVNIVLDNMEMIIQRRHVAFRQVL
jgi:hypothetical protein